MPHVRLYVDRRWDSWSSQVPSKDSVQAHYLTRITLPRANRAFMLAPHVFLKLCLEPFLVVSGC
eukprot:1436152-Amphidinium_carterae.1